MFHSFRGYEDVLTRTSSSSGKTCLQGRAHLALIAISFRTVEMPRPSFERVLVALIVVAASESGCESRATGISRLHYEGILCSKSVGDS